MTPTLNQSQLKVDDKFTLSNPKFNMPEKYSVPNIFDGWEPIRVCPEHNYLNLVSVAIAEEVACRCVYIDKDI